MYGEQIRNARESKGMSLQDLANEIADRYGTPTTRQNIAKYENGTAHDIELLHAIFDVLGLNRDQLPKLTKNYAAFLMLNGNDLEKTIDDVRKEADFWKNVFMDRKSKAKS